MAYMKPLPSQCMKRIFMYKREKIQINVKIKPLINFYTGHFTKNEFLFLQAFPLLVQRLFIPRAKDIKSLIFIYMHLDLQSLFRKVFRRKSYTVFLCVNGQS